MSFYNRYGRTKIIDTRIDNLSISFDCDIPEDNKIGAVFLFTPDMEDTSEHYHIAMDREQVKILRDWCDDFLKEEDLLVRYEKDLKNKG